MIVRDEARIIRRCLEAARPLIDCALVVDTGSSDSTIAEIRGYFRETGLEGEVALEPWRDFASNRSSARARMRAHADVDYALMIDADDQVVVVADFDAGRFRAGLSADAYEVWTRLGGHSYTRPQLIGNHKPFAFKGALHEYLDCAEPRYGDSALNWSPSARPTPAPTSTRGSPGTRWDAINMAL